MKATRYAAVALTLALTSAVALSFPAWAQPAQPSDQASVPDFAQLEPIEAAANSKPGPRTVPGRAIPVPTDVSPELQSAIAAPYRSPAWNLNPRTPEEWKQAVAKLAAATAATIPPLREKLGVVSQETTIGGVHAYIVQPKDIPPQNQNRLLFHIHGGGYVYNPGEAGTQEAVLMAGYGKFKVISIDYRMPPDYPYPAAMDDNMAAWKAAVTMAKPKNIGVFGTSAGGAMTLALVLRAKAEGLPMPAAIAPGTPAADMTETGDSYRTNEWLDNVLVSYNGYVSHAAQLYANGHDMKDPQLSPIYGDFHGFPPAILTTGTRDLFLSNTVRTHRKLREAGVEAELQVFEGISHAQYQLDANTPESKEAFEEIARFFDAHLGK
jgi:epsilon-lactone hydrolase